MSRKKMWFGTRQHMQWITPPAINYDNSLQGWTSKTTYLNGGAHIRRSFGSHKEVNLSWNLQSRQLGRKITDYFGGMYGAGEIYWCDPMEMDMNLMPYGWSVPVQNALDGPPLISNTAPRASRVLAPTSDHGYPTESAALTVPAGGGTKKVWIPVPPGYTAWVGVTGSAGTGGRVGVRPTIGAAYLSPEILTIFRDGQSAQWWEGPISLPNADGLEIRLAGAGTMTLNSIMVQVLPTGATPKPTGFISGGGMTGAQFETSPSISAYSAALDKVGISAKFTEVEAWQ